MIIRATTICALDNGGSSNGAFSNVFEAGQRQSVVDAGEWSTHISTPQHFPVCGPVHVCSDPASSHVLVSLHPHSPWWLKSCL